MPADWKEIRGTAFQQFFNADTIASTFKKQHDEFDNNLNKMNPIINKVENKAHRLKGQLDVIGTTNQNLNWIDQLK